MKPPFRHFYALLLTVALLIPVAMVDGCKSSQEQIAFRTTGVVVVTATTAMEAWLDWKNTHGAPADQIARVKAAWDKFYAADLAAQVAVTAFKTNNDTNALTRAITLTSQISSEVVGVILQFLPPEKAAKLKGGK